MHTTPETGNPDLLAMREQFKLERLRYKLTMIRVQTKALETLERLMDEPELTGNEKADKAKATERNRQRLAANQTLIHCRTADREKRLARASRHANDKRQRLEPNRASDGSQATGEERPSPLSPLAGEGGRASGRMRGWSEPSDDQSEVPNGAVPKSEASTEGAGFADNSSPPTPSHGLRPADHRAPTTPPKKFIKPKHPRRSSKRKRKQVRC